jgi:DNA-binding CsgD family transcriptional regulator
MLRGRRDECEVVEGLLERVRAGASGALVVRGEAGVGKTALLEHAIEQASDFRVVRAVGVESEMELAFAGLHQVCAPMLDRLDRLPAPQRDALRTTFGLIEGPVPDRFFVGLAVLGLLSEVAEPRPLLCVVDDAQWLDRSSGQALAFVARRLLAESVLLLFGTREASEELGGLPELVVRGLRDRDARELLASAVPWRLDERVRDQIVAETRGNPLALLELPRGLSPGQLAGGFGLPAVAPDAQLLPGRIEESFRRRLGDLPAETQLLLLVAAAEPVGDPVVVWGAAERLGIGYDALAPAQAADLLEIGAQVRFRHPLVRSAVYGAASADDRQRAHASLAEATDPGVDPDRRVFHRAQAATEPDEEVASELEQSAGRAQRRGGLAAAGLFLERAAELTVDPALRSDRVLAAAHAKHLAGASDAALALLVGAEAGPLDELQRARVGLLRGQIAFTSSHGRDAPPLLLDAARRLEPLDVTLARETYLDALGAAEFVGRLADRADLADVAAAARRAPAASSPVRAPDVLLDGLAVLFTEGYESGTPMVRQALEAFRSGEIAPEQELRWGFIASRSAHDLWDDESWHALCSRQVELARGAGALAVLALALNQRIGLHLHAGELAAASSLVEELQVIADATGNELPPYGAMALAGWQGHEAKAAALIDTTLSNLEARGEGMGLSLSHYTSAVLRNGLGQHDSALSAAQQASAYPLELGFSNWALVELIEAASRSGDAARAEDALEQLVRTTHPSGTQWGLGIEARCRALLTEGAAAEGLYREAIDRLGRTRMRVELARAHLLYGEWLRQEQRRRDAREELRAAYEMLSVMGLEAFAQRASHELLATGERTRRRAVETQKELTAQEAQIARLARDGLSNPEIGARLFISPRTVEYHLGKVFSKLNITARGQLERALPREDTTALAV